MAAKPLSVAVVADTKELQAALAKAEAKLGDLGDEAKGAGGKVEAAQRSLDASAEGADTLASKGAQAAGALSGLGDTLSVLPGPLGAVGKGFQVLGPAMQTAADAGDLWNAAIEGGGKAISAFKNGALKMIQILKLDKAAKAVATAAQWAWNAALDANPIGIVVLAVAALVAGLTLFFTKTQLGQQIVQNVFGAIRTAIGAVTEWWTGTAVPAIGAAWDAVTGFFSTAGQKIGNVMNAVWGVIKTVWSYTPLGAIVANWGAIMSFFGSIPGKVKAVFGAAVSWLVSAGSNILGGLKNGASAGWNAVASWFGGIGSRILGALGSVGTLLINAGKSIIDGFLSGLKAGFEKVKDFVGGIGSWIADHKGPKAYDLKLLVPNAGWIMTGLADGLEKALPKVQSTLSGVASAIQSTDFGSPTVDVAATVSGGSGGGNITFNITVQTLNPTAEVGRAVVKSVEEYARIGGTVRFA